VQASTTEEATQRVRSSHGEDCLDGEAPVERSLASAVSKHSRRSSSRSSRFATLSPDPEQGKETLAMSLSATLTAWHVLHTPPGKRRWQGTFSRYGRGALSERARVSLERRPLPWELIHRCRFLRCCLMLSTLTRAM